MNPHESFAREVGSNVQRLRGDADLQALSRLWVREVSRYKYAHNFTWLGRPIIQCPQDIIAVQELIWRTRPQVVVETGIAHGGSLIFSASVLELLGGDGYVVGVDIDIRAHNRAAIGAHPLAKRVRMIEGSSIDPAVADAVVEECRGAERVLVLLDSNHTHEHVLAELRLYSPLVRRGSYLVVFDTIIEDMPDDSFPDRPWGKGNNPKTAVHAFLRTTDRFRIDRDMEAKLLITVAPDGYLECVKD
jgi:cephalosporin hydroxylase